MSLSDDVLNSHVAVAHDRIVVSNLLCRNVVGVERWERRKEQRLFITFIIWCDTRHTGETDVLSSSFNYGLCAGLVTQYAEQAHFKTAEAVACGVAQLLIAGCGVAKCTVKVVKPASLLYAQGAGAEVTRSCRDYPNGYSQCITTGKQLDKGATEFTFPEETVCLPHRDDMIFIKGLLVRCIIGVNPWERESKQNVNMDIVFYADCGSVGASDLLQETIDYRTVCRHIIDSTEKSEFKTLEAFVNAVAKLCVVTCSVPRITVRAEKPSALVFADSAGVEITRTAEDFRTTL